MGNKLILSQLTWDDQGDYQCKSPSNNYYRFRLYISDRDQGEFIPDTQPSTDGPFIDDTVKPVSMSNIDARPNTLVELACGPTTEQDRYIEWRKLDGVCIQEKTRQNFLFSSRKSYFKMQIFCCAC